MVADAVTATLAALGGVLSGGWTGGSSGVRAIVTGIPVPTMNGVWALSADASPATIGAALDDVAARGAPFCLQARPTCAASAARAAEARALIEAPARLPLMAMSGPAPDAGVPELRIRRLGPKSSGLHGALAARAFGAPADLFDQVTDPALTLAGTRVYLGEVDGEPVTTGLAVALRDAVAVFNVATPPEHRGRGYASAITARAINDGLAAGASWSWLQSSDAGLGVYERLGFQTLELWSCWVSM